MEFLKFFIIIFNFSDFIQFRIGELFLWVLGGSYALKRLKHKEQFKEFYTNLI